MAEKNYEEKIREIMEDLAIKEGIDFYELRDKPLEETKKIFDKIRKKAEKIYSQQNGAEKPEPKGEKSGEVEGSNDEAASKINKPEPKGDKLIQGLGLDAAVLAVIEKIVESEPPKKSYPSEEENQKMFDNINQLIADKIESVENEVSKERLDEKYNNNLDSIRKRISAAKIYEPFREMSLDIEIKDLTRKMSKVTDAAEKVKLGRKLTVKKQELEEFKICCKLHDELEKLDKVRAEVAKANKPKSMADEINALYRKYGEEAIHKLILG